MLPRATGIFPIYFYNFLSSGSYLILSQPVNYTIERSTTTIDLIQKRNQDVLAISACLRAAVRKPVKLDVGNGTISFAGSKREQTA